MNGLEITLQTESKLAGSKITPQTNGQLTEQLKNNSPNGWTDGELNEKLENNSPNGWSKMVGSKITRQKNVFLADIDPYFGELIRKLFCSKYDIASSEGNRTEHKPLPWTGLYSTDARAILSDNGF